MEIKDINPTAKQTFRFIDLDGAEQEITLDVKYIPPYSLPDYVAGKKAADLRLSRLMTDALVDAIVEWDVTINGEPVPCTRENKEKFLPALLSARVPGVESEVFSLEAFLVGAVLNFAGDQKSFLKN